MRFLLHRSLAKAVPSASSGTSSSVTQSSSVKPRRRIKSLRAPPLPSTQTITKTLSASSSASNGSDAETTATTNANAIQSSKWGQQCGVKCGCVVNIQLDLDASQTVVQSHYTAKRVVQQQQQRAQPTSPFSPNAQRSHRRHLLGPCQCPTVHHVADAAVQYFVGHRLDHLQNLVVSPRASTAFVRTVLRQQQQQQVNDEQKYPYMTSLFGSKSSQQTQQEPQQSSTHGSTTKQTACFGIVEDACIAALWGYFPAPLKPSGPSSLSLSPSWACDPLSASGRDDDDDDDDDHDNRHPVASWYRFGASSSGQSSSLSSSSSSSSSSPLSSWNDGSIGLSSNNDNEASSNNNNTRHWTALDWMDWHNDHRDDHEHDRITNNHNDTKNSHGRRLSDWLSYVDWQRSA